MPLHELVESDRVVGAKSVLRRLLRSEIKKIFLHVTPKERSSNPY